MPIYRYKAKKGVNELIEGALSAESQEDAVNKLSQKGLFPVEIEEKEEQAITASKKNRTSIFSKFSFKINIRRKTARKIHTKQLLVFTQKLATLMRAKIELLPALQILFDQTVDEDFKLVIKTVYNQVKKGIPLSRSLEDYPRIFSPLYVSIIKAGEASGSMDEALSNILDFMKRKEALKNKVIGALIYPAILLFVGFVSVILILTFVVPKLKTIFSDLQTALPVFTKVILSISNFTVDNWPYEIIGGCALAYFLFIFKDGALVKNVAAGLSFKLPLIKRVIKNQELTNFSRSFSLLIRTGVSPLESLEIAALTVENLKMKEQLLEAAVSIKEGKTIADSLGKFETLPDFFISMIAVGEESGRLKDVLDEIASSYTEEIDSDINVITSILEPVLILSIGVILGAIVIAILLPVFQVTQIIQ
jgi:type II secretory pathway component PulF